MKKITHSNNPASFSTSRARAIAIDGVPGELWREQDLIWWKLPEYGKDEDLYRVMTTDQTSYGRFPRADVRVTNSNWSENDTSTVIGTLAPYAAKKFSSSHEPLHCQYRIKRSHAQTYLPFPQEIENAIPALSALLLTQRRNLPDSSLWDYISVDIRVGRNWIKPRENGGAVHKTTVHRSKRWHYHFSLRENVHAGRKSLPDFDTTPYLLGRDCVISDVIGTEICDELFSIDSLVDDRVEALQRQGYEIVDGGQIRSKEGKRYAVKGRFELPAYHVGMMSQLSMHRSVPSSYKEPIFRSFARSFPRISSSTLRKALREHPTLLLPDDRPEQILVPRTLV